MKPRAAAWTCLLVASSLALAGCSGQDDGSRGTSNGAGPGGGAGGAGGGHPFGGKNTTSTTAPTSSPAPTEVDGIPILHLAPGAMTLNLSMAASGVVHALVVETNGTVNMPNVGPRGTDTTSNSERAYGIAFVSLDVGQPCAATDLHVTSYLAGSIRSHDFAYDGTQYALREGRYVLLAWNNIYTDGLALSFSGTGDPMRATANLVPSDWQRPTFFEESGSADIQKTYTFSPGTMFVGVKATATRPAALAGPYGLDATLRNGDVPCPTDHTGNDAPSPVGVNEPAPAPIHRNASGPLTDLTLAFRSTPPPAGLPTVFVYNWNVAIVSIAKAAPATSP